MQSRGTQPISPLSFSLPAFPSLRTAPLCEAVELNDTPLAKLTVWSILPKSIYVRSKALGQAFDSIIAIGVLIKGDTAHFEYISESVSRGLMTVQLDHEVLFISYSRYVFN